MTGENNNHISDVHTGDKKDNKDHDGGAAMIMMIAMIIIVMI